MRGLRSTAALIVVLGGLVAYIYFVDREQPLTEVDAKAKAFDVSPENIEEVAVTNAAGEVTRVQRIDTSWQLTEPERADADAAEVASMTSSLASLEVQRVVDDQPADLAQYGLDRPRTDVAFRVRGQDEFQRLLIGEKSPAGGDLYAKTPGQDRVFLISSFLDTTFSKTPFDLRDKTVLKFVRDRAETLEIQRGGEPLAFAKQGNEWRIARPIEARADFAAVEGLVTRIDEAKLKRFVADDPSDLRQYGLNAPSVRVVVANGDTPAELLIGTTDPDGLVFAKDAAKPAVFTIEQSLVDELSKAVGDFRRKDVFDARSFTATRVEIRRGSETRVLEKSSSGDTETWHDADGTELDRTKVEDLLSRLTALRAASFEQTRHASLAAPVLTTTIHFGDKDETVTFGQAGGDVHVARGDEPGSALLEAGTFDGVATALDGLQ